MNCDIHETKTMRLVRCTNQFVAAWHSMTPPAPLSSRQFHTLSTISFMSRKTEKGVTVSDLASKIGVSSAAVSQNVTALVDLGMLERVQDKSDRRVIYLHITQTGGETLHTAFSKVLALMEEATQDMDSDALCTQLLQYTDAVKLVTAQINEGEKTKNA